MPFIVYVFDVFIGAMAVFISEHMWSQSIPFLIKLIKYDFIQILIIPILIINADLIKYKASQGNKKSTIE